MLKKILFTAILFSFFNTSFSQNKETTAEIEKIKTENTILNAKVQTLEAKVELLKLEIENLKTQFATLAKQSATTQPTTESQTTPQVLKSQYPSSSSASKGQCTATTKAGNRCSRTSRSNGLCWQHGG